MRNTYKVLAEKYNSVYGGTYTPERTVRQVPFDNGELKVLTALYDFKKVKDSPVQLTRIVAAGEIEDVIKYSDNAFVRMTNDSRGVVKHEYNSFFDLTKALTRIYKANQELNSLQVPKGKSMPMGTDLTPGGQQ